GKVNRGAALAGLFIDGRAVFHVMSNVGDVDMEFVVSVGQVIHKHGVVKIPSGFAVDGHNGQVPIVVAALQFAVRDSGVELLGLLANRLGEDVTDMVLANDDLNIDAKIILAAQDLHYAATWALGGRWPLDDFDFNYETFEIVSLARLVWHSPGGRRTGPVLPGLGLRHPRLRLSVDPRRRLHAFYTTHGQVGTALGRCLGMLHARGDDDLAGHFLVYGCHIVVATAVVEFAHHSLLLVFGNSEDSPFRPPVLADGAHLHQNLVAVHGVADGGRRNEYVALQLAPCARRKRVCFRGNKAVTITMHSQLAHNQALV